jgi:probable H4MPT-linked C1 transfer pathway protein
MKGFDPMTIIAGLDIGGAHLKAARSEDGSIAAAHQFASPLWKGERHLKQALDGAKEIWAGADQIAVTMTGELSDVFANRKAGVYQIVKACAEQFGPIVRFWAAPGVLKGAGEAFRAPDAYGSMNFLATAAFVGRREPDALLIDMGSTTTDIIPVAGGKPVPAGLTDAERQKTGELVYTGFSRTPVMGVATSAPLGGQRVELAREVLATMADVQRIRGALPEGADVQDTADGRGKSVEESTVRLARMFGCDADERSGADWRAAANYLWQAQLSSIAEGLGLVVSRHPALAPSGTGAQDSDGASACVVVTGLAADALRVPLSALGYRVRDFDDLVPAAGSVSKLDINSCATAVSLALLAGNEKGPAS